MRSGSRVWRYVGRRLLTVIPQIFMIMVSVFVLIRLLPTDPVARKVGSLATPEAIAQARAQLGLDQSMFDQFKAFLGEVAQFRLGASWETSDEVLDEILAVLPVTLQLLFFSFLIAIVIAVPLGTLAALRPGGKSDKSVFYYGLFAGAQPEFWWGLMFIFVFCYQFDVFPAPLGLVDPATMVPEPITGFILIDALLVGDLGVFWDAATHLMLPSLTLAFVISGPIVKTTRQNMVRVLGSDFILHARARGLKPRHVASYALRNALPPVVTLIGILIGFMLGGAVLIEQIFSLNGVGQYALTRTLALDFPAMQGVVLIMTTFSLIVYLIVDVLYTVIDPRIEV